MTISPTQDRRYDRLALLIEDTGRVREDCPAMEAIDAMAELPRFAATSYDGNDCWISLHPDREDAATYLAGEAQGEVPWAPGDIVDLDTGQGWGATVRVVCVAWSSAAVASYANAPTVDR